VTPPLSETRVFVLGGYCRVIFEDISGTGGIPSLIRQELERIEKKFSFFSPESVISIVNQCAGTGVYTTLDGESLGLFRYVSALWKQSGHLFDPTTHLLRDCYDAGGRRRATDDELKRILRLVDWSKLEIGPNGARLAEKGMLMQLDSCIRAYAVDSVRKILLNRDIQHALIEMDQDRATIGKQADGANWLVGVRYPRGNGTAITRLKLNQRGFALRGDFETSPVQGGERHGRLLSPLDGQPVPGLLSVAVIADDCLTACSAASIARLKPEEDGIQWLDELGFPWFAIDRRLNCHGPLSP